MANDDKLVIPNPDDAQEEAVARTRARDEGSLDWEYVYDFREMVRELEASDGIVDVEAHVSDPVATFTIETLEHGLGFEVPRRIKQFYLVADGLSLEWSIERDGDVVPGGGIELFDFATVFDSWLGELWPTDTDPDDDGFLWSLRGLADLPDSGRDDMVVLCVEEEYPTYDLFLHDPEAQHSELMTLDFRRYLDVLLETRGTYGWHHLLSEAPLRNETQLQRVHHFYETMERHFPDVDLERYPDPASLAPEPESRSTEPTSNDPDEPDVSEESVPET
jgi:hypothetical protein